MHKIYKKMENKKVPFGSNIDNKQHFSFVDAQVHILILAILQRKKNKKTIREPNKQYMHNIYTYIYIRKSTLTVNS